MQPVQDLTIDATVSRTQYQFVLEDANAARVRDLGAEAGAAPRPDPADRGCRQHIFRQNGLSAYVNIDRDTAARFGITPATVDNALYDAFGQRIVSTIFTQSNQYRVILEADPMMQQSLNSLGSIYLPSSTAVNGQVPLSAIAQIEEQTAPLEIDHLGQFPATTVSFNLAPGASLGAGGRRDPAGREGHRHADQHDHRLPGRRAGVSGRARQRADPDPRRDRHDLHRAGRALRELHPPDHDPLDPALGRGRRAAWR